MYENANLTSRAGPKNWKALFQSCPHIAGKICDYLDVKSALTCRQVYPEWKLVVDSCRPLIKRANDVTPNNPDHKTAFQGDFTMLFEFLCEKEGDVDELDRWGRPALLKAVWMGNVAMVQKFLEKGASAKASLNGYTALYWAVVNGQCDMAELLINHGADINKPDSQGRSLLHLARGKKEMVKLLKSKGAK